jgi:hypothetical protein
MEIQYMEIAREVNCILRNISCMRDSGFIIPNYEIIKPYCKLRLVL